MPPASTLLGDVQISHPQAKFLEFVGDHDGGEIAHDWARWTRPDARAMLVDLINKRLLVEREYVTHALQAHGALKIKLTELGHKVVEQLRALRTPTKVVAAV